jgi:hypothetical protein
MTVYEVTVSSVFIESWTVYVTNRAGLLTALETNIAFTDVDRQMIAMNFDGESYLFDTPTRHIFVEVEPLTIY